MRRLRLTSPADADYFEGLAWYEQCQPGLGKQFDAELDALFQRIRKSPELFIRETPTVRRARMPRFKYGIYFTVANDEIGVLAIYHPSRNPATLRERFKQL
jgi:plasmid stabilization system protein ParE